MSRNFKKILSFKVRVTYEQARAIADCMCIGLMRFGNSDVTYASAVTYSRLSKFGAAWRRYAHDPHIDSLSEAVQKTRDDTMVRRISIFKVCGNRGSALSPSQNDMFKKLIYSGDLIDTLNSLGLNAENRK